MEENMQLVSDLKKVFLLTIFLLCLFSIFLFCIMIKEAIFLLLHTIILFGFFLSIVYTSSNKNPLKNEMLTYVLFLILIFHLKLLNHSIFKMNEIQFSSSGHSNNNYILKFDIFLLGWLFEKGQLALSFANTINSTHEIVLNNILQLFQFISHILPYCILGIPLYYCIQDSLYIRSHKGKKPKSHNHHWNDMFYIATIYIQTYILILITKGIISALSPSIALATEFRKQLQFTNISDLLKRITKLYEQQYSFPSINAGISNSITFALFLMKYKKLKLILLFISIMIFLSSIFLRYHYFTDLLAAYIISFISYMITSQYYVNPPKKTVNRNLTLQDLSIENIC